MYSGILLSYKKEWSPVICSDVYGPSICHPEWSKKEKQILYINTYMESRKNSAGEHIGKAGIEMQM